MIAIYNMAEIRLQAPDPFNFSSPDDWSRWKKYLNNFASLQVWKKTSKANRSTPNFIVFCVGVSKEMTVHY